jgi:acetyl esterase/lipase
VAILLSSTSCAFKSVSRNKNISYAEYDSARSIPVQKLNVFRPRKPKTPREVLVFIHGGSWRSGKKSLYSFLGNRFARKGIVCVIISYPLTPIGDFNDMAISSARAVKWVHNNIKTYGGDANKIFLSGHSAGGHLAALIAIREEYFDSVAMENPVKGVVLIDAAGLDMYGYLKEDKKPEGHSYLKTFTCNPAIWKEASPIYHLHDMMPPLLIYRGGKTYPSISKSTEKFVSALKAFVPTVNYKVQKEKKHVPMITQFFWITNPLYKEILKFMREPK